MEAALSSKPDRSREAVQTLVEKLKKPFVTDPKVHGAMFGPREAKEAGLPVEEPTKAQWEMVWRLWTKYFTLIRGRTLIYEGRTTSQVVSL